MADSPPPRRDSGRRPTDVELAARVTVGDRTAFAALYDRYAKPAYSLARRICVDPDLAEDVVQEAFLALWLNPAACDSSRGGFGTWLMTVVHHRAVDAVRRENAKSRRSVPLADEVSERNVTPAEGADYAALTGVVGRRTRGGFAFGLSLEQGVRCRCGRRPWGHPAR